MTNIIFNAKPRLISEEFLCYDDCVAILNGHHDDRYVVSYRYNNGPWQEMNETEKVMVSPDLVIKCLYK